MAFAVFLEGEVDDEGNDGDAEHWDDDERGGADAVTGHYGAVVRIGGCGRHAE